LGLKIMKKHGLKKAAMAVGRKLAVIMHRMLMTGESFRFSNKDQCWEALNLDFKHVLEKMGSRSSL